MHVNLPLRMPNVTTQRNSHVPPIFMTSLAAAMPVPEQSEFHIRRDTVTPRERELRTQQLLAATALTLFFFIGFFAYSMYTAYTFRSEVQQRQQKLQNQIKNTFGISTKSKTKIPDLIGQAKKKVSQEESLWFSLSQQRRNSFLYYLQELSTYVDRKDLGLTLRKLVIQRDSKQGTETMKLEGRVKDYPALKKFETALRESKLFTQIPPLQDVTFDITLTIQPSKE